MNDKKPRHDVQPTASTNDWWKDASSPKLTVDAYQFDPKQYVPVAGTTVHNPGKPVYDPELWKSPAFAGVADELRAQRNREQLAQTQADVRELREQITGLARMMAQLVPAIANLQSPLPAAGTPAGLLPPAGGLVPARKPLFGGSMVPTPRVLTPEVLPPGPLPLVPTEPIVHSDVRRTVIRYPDGTTRTVGETEDRTTIDPMTGSRALETTTRRYMSDDGYLLHEAGNIFACSRCESTGLAHIQHCYACQRPLCWACVSTTTDEHNNVIVHCSRHRPRTATQSGSWFDLDFSI